jgi:hypothetical protein
MFDSFGTVPSVATWSMRMNNPGPRLIAAAGIVFASSLTVSVYTQQRAATQAHNDPPAPAPAPGPPPPSGRTYVGSEACRRCHAPIYERWSKTRMAIRAGREAVSALRNRLADKLVRTTRGGGTRALLLISDAR